LIQLCQFEVDISDHGQRIQAHFNPQPAAQANSQIIIVFILQLEM